MTRAAARYSAGSRGRISRAGIFTEEMLPPREQGDFGELATLVWLARQGAKVSIPLGHNPHYDLVADLNGSLVRVQVKTCTLFRGRWHVTLCTRGGNQSWNGLVKHLNPSRYDYLFVLVGDGRQWFHPIPQCWRRKRHSSRRPQVRRIRVGPRRTHPSRPPAMSRLYNRLATPPGGCPSG
jgi:PD-(D/E)XK endonuclease